MKFEFRGNRRAFLKGAAIFGGLALLLGLERPAASKPEPSASPQEPAEKKGYRVTEHVKKYYETARS